MTQHKCFWNNVSKYIGVGRISFAFRTKGFCLNRSYTRLGPEITMVFDNTVDYDSSSFSEWQVAE